MNRFPAVFVSHGAPNLVLHNSEARAFLAGYGERLGRPAAVIVVSAHFETAAPTVVTDPQPAMIYDFRGFERALYEIEYPAPGAPDLATAIAAGLGEAGFAVCTLERRGYDHGAWVPLSLLYPEADIPVVQVSVQAGRDAAYHFALGRALAKWRDAGCLILCSGSLTHNLYEAFVPGTGLRPVDEPAPDWVREFADWIAGRLAAGDSDALVGYRGLAPHAARNHPSEEHFMPLLVAFGAAGEGARAERVHASHQHGVLAMDAYAFR